MFDIITKILARFLLFFGLLGCTIQSQAQESDSCRYLKLTIGGGYGNYFNNFTNVNDKDVVNNRPAFSGRLLWQPEHRLRIGVESGLYYLYSTTRIQTDGGTDKLTTNLKVVPIFFSVSMRVVNHLELNFATGWTSMIYTIHVNKSTKNVIKGQTYSMSNLATGFTYIIPLGQRLELGLEAKYLYLGKTDDSHISGLINLSYKLRKWKVK